MSRTYRERPFAIVGSDGDAFYWATSDRTEEDLFKTITRHYLDGHPGNYSMAREWRKVIVKTRRAVDRMEITRIMKDPEYIPAMSTWDNKDSELYYYM